MKHFFTVDEIAFLTGTQAQVIRYAIRTKQLEAAKTTKNYAIELDDLKAWTASQNRIITEQALTAYLNGLKEDIMK